VSTDIIPNSAVGIFPLQTEGAKTKAARVLISWLHPTNLLFAFCYTAETESEVAEKSS
jgi:hypothetical protein